MCGGLGCGCPCPPIRNDIVTPCHLLHQFDHHGWMDQQTDGWTDRWTDGRTDKASYRDARMHLKTGNRRKKFKWEEKTGGK